MYEGQCYKKRDLVCLSSGKRPCLHDQPNTIRLKEQS